MKDLAARDFSRILITRADRLGDLVLSTPVFDALRRKYPNAWIACLAFLENREIVEGNPFLDEVILYDKHGSEKSFWGNLRFAGRLRQKKFDLVIHLHATNRMHGVGFLAGIPTRLGWNRRAEHFLTRPLPYFKKEGLKHEAEYNFELLKPLGISIPDQLETFFPLTDRARLSLDELLRQQRISKDLPWVVIHPGAGCVSKVWPAERFAHLMEEMAGRYSVQFFVVGSRDDRKRVEKIRCGTSIGFHDLTGRLSLGMLAHLLKDAALLISNDSGPVHIASAVGTPVIAIFGRRQPGLSPTRWRPLGENSRVLWKDAGCSDCLAHLCQVHFLCLDIISVHDVMHEVESVLSPHDKGEYQNIGILE